MGRGGYGPFGGGTPYAQRLIAERVGGPRAVASLNRFDRGIGGASSNMGTWYSNWNKRIDFFKQNNIPERIWSQVAQFDLRSKVMTGGFPMGNVEAMQMIAALQNKDLLGYWPADPKTAGSKPQSHSSGLFGSMWGVAHNVLGDLKSTALAVNPLTLAPKIWHEAVAASALPEAMGFPKIIRNFQIASYLAPHLYSKDVAEIQAYGKQIDAKIARGDWGGAIADTFMGQPLLRDIPTAYTIGTIARGNWGDFYQHPLFHTLDVLPAATAAGKLIALAPEVEGATAFGRIANAAKGGLPSPLVGSARIPVGGAAEAFAKGQFFRGAGRAMFGKYPEPPSAQALNLVKQVNDWIASAGGEAHVVFPRGTEFARRWANRFWLDTPTRESNRLAMNAEKTVAYARDVFHRQFMRLTQGWTDEERAAFTKALSMGDDKAPILQREGAEPLFHHIVEVNDKLKNYMLNSGDKTHMVIPGPDGTEHIYRWNDPAAKAYRNYLNVHNKATQADIAYATRGRMEYQAQVRLYEKVLKTRDAEMAARANFADVWAEHPPDTMNFFLGQKGMDKLYAQTAAKIAKAKKAGDPAGELEGLNTRMVGLSQNSLRTAGVTDAEYKAAYDDIAPHWQEYWNKGIHPIYVPNPEAAQIDTLFSVKPMLDNVSKADFLNEKNIYRMDPVVQPVQVVYTWAQVQQVLSEAEKAGVREVAHLYGVKVEDALNLAKRQILRFHPHTSDVDLDVKARRIVDKSYYGWNPEKGHVQYDFDHPENTPLLVPRDVANVIRDQWKGFTKQSRAGIGPYDRAMNMYRFAITFTLRHIVHINVLGAMSLLANQGPEAFLKLPAAWKIAHDFAHAKVPETPNLFIGMMERHGWKSVTEDEMLGFAHQHMLGDWFSNRLGETAKYAGLDKPAIAANWIKHQEELMSNMYRAASYLYEHDKFRRSGVDEAFAQQEALKIAYRTHMDFDGMAPPERIIQRYIIPFYGFTRQIMRFLWNYPADHPLRAAFVANMARMEADDRRSGLPWAFSNYLMLGTPNGKGVVTADDLKTLNPFRSVEGQDIFTLPGLISGMAPTIQGPMTALGINPMTATDAYQQLHAFDPYTGNIVAKAGIGEMFKDTFATLPQVDVLGSLFGWSTAMDYLKAQDAAYGTTNYRRALMTAIGIPFVPFDVNMYQQRLRYQQHIYAISKQAISEAEQGHFDDLKKFARFPFQGQLATRSQVEDAIAHGLNPENAPTSVPAQ
jgi:hypothetical protein